MENAELAQQIWKRNKSNPVNLAFAYMVNPDDRNHYLTVRGKIDKKVLSLDPVSADVLSAIRAGNTEKLIEKLAHYVQQLNQELSCFPQGKFDRCGFRGITADSLRTFLIDLGAPSQILNDSHLIYSRLLERLYRTDKVLNLENYVAALERNAERLRRNFETETLAFPKESFTTPQQVVLAQLRDNHGVCIGEKHEDGASVDLLLSMIRSGELVDAGVTTICLEFLEMERQQQVDEFLNSAVENPEEIIGLLPKKGYHWVSEILCAAREAGLRVVGLEAHSGMHTDIISLFGDGRHTNRDRAEIFDPPAATIIRDSVPRGEKFIALAGMAHFMHIQKDISRKKTTAQLLGVPAVRVVSEDTGVDSTVSAPQLIRDDENLWRLQVQQRSSELSGGSVRYDHQNSPAQFICRYSEDNQNSEIYRQLNQKVLAIVSGEVSDLHENQNKHRTLLRLVQKNKILWEKLMQTTREKVEAKMQELDHHKAAQVKAEKIENFSKTDLPNLVFGLLSRLDALPSLRNNVVGAWLRLEAVNYSAKNELSTYLRSNPRNLEMNDFCQHLESYRETLMKNDGGKRQRRYMNDLAEFLGMETGALYTQKITPKLVTDCYFAKMDKVAAKSERELSGERPDMPVGGDSTNIGRI